MFPGSPIGHAGGGSGDGAASVTTLTSSATITTAQVGDFIYVNMATPGAFHLPSATASLLNKSIWFYKAGVGTLDINAFDEGNGTDDIEGEVDVENTTTETFASIQLKCTAVGSWSIIGLIGSWQ